MLMVDALDRNGISRADVPLVRLLAGLLADALAQPVLRAAVSP